MRIYVVSDDELLFLFKALGILCRTRADVVESYVSLICRRKRHRKEEVWMEVMKKKRKSEETRKHVDDFLYKVFSCYPSAITLPA